MYGQDIQQSLMSYSRLLSNIDYLIDGKFEEDKKDVRLRLRGSSNQRIWHILHKEKENHLFEVTEEKGWRE